MTALCAFDIYTIREEINCEFEERSEREVRGKGPPTNRNSGTKSFFNDLLRSMKFDMNDLHTAEPPNRNS